MPYVVDLQIVDPQPRIPSPEKFQLWVENALKELTPSGELTIRIVDKKESQYLNKTYRDQDKPTNVLSFPIERIKDVTLSVPLLGDLVICAQIVEEEALLQQKELEAHWAHLVTHGILHLLGYDHIHEEDALRMETLEIKLLKQLDYQNPYD